MLDGGFTPPPPAMALLRKDQSEGTSYLELAEFLHARGAKDHIEADLEQLFRRVVFNVASVTATIICGTMDFF
jgi:hypothetical protein